MKRIVMLLANVWETDSRVRREATAIAQAGYEVHVICNEAGADYYMAESDGVIYHCLPKVTGAAYIAGVPGMIMLHYRVMIAAIRDDWSNGARERAARRVLTAAGGGLFQVLAMLAASVMLGPFLLIRGGIGGVIWLLARLIKMFPAPRNAQYSLLRSAYGTLMRLIAAISRRLWGLTYRAWRIVHLDSILYLNQFSVRAISLARSLDPDAVHAHDLVTLSGGFAVSTDLRIPLIYDAHELETHTNYWGLSRHTRKWIEFYERYLARRCTKIITVCDSIADWLRDTYGMPRPLVVYNSPDLRADDQPANTVDTLRNRLGLASDIPLAVYVGSVTLDRGLVECVHALAFSPELHMAFVGPRYSVTEAEILGASANLGVQDRVHLVDSVPSQLVTAFVSDADCSVIPIQNVCLSYYFCFPNKLLESVLAGVPVVAARLIELERFVNRFEVGVIADETDPKSIADAIDAVIRDRSRFAPSIETRRQIAAEYGWATQSRRLLDLYVEVLGAPELRGTRATTAA